MPRLRNFFDSLLLKRVERRAARADGELKAEDRETRALLQILRERESEIERLKTTDESRAAIFRKCLSKLRRKRREAKSLRRKNRTLRRLLKQRRVRLRVAWQRLSELNAAASAREACLAVVGEPVPLSFENDPVANGANWLMRGAASLSDWPWKHWMRLGSYFQYDPRPVELDRIPQVKRIGGGWPKITIVTPSFQQADYLERTLRSVIDQDYPNLEYFVLDGGSRDGSVDIIRRYAAHLAGWESRPDGGQAAAVREGLSRGTGEIMAWLNSDDVIYPGTLRYVADYFDRHPEVDVVFGHRIVIDKNDCETARWVLPPHDPEFLSWADFLPQECTFWRRRIYEKVGGMDPSFRFALDWDLFLRFQRAGAKMVRLPYFMGGFRIHPEQKNAVTIGSDGHREMKRIRDEALGHLFQRGGLEKRMNWFQARAVTTTWLWRLGIRI